MIFVTVCIFMPQVNIWNKRCIFKVDPLCMWILSCTHTHGWTVVSDWRDWTSSSDFWRLGWRDFLVPTVLLSTFIPFFLTSSPLSLIVLFQSCCSHAQMFGRTLVHEFHFSYSHTEWNLLFLKQIPLRHEATWDKPEASIKTETEEETYSSFLNDVPLIFLLV